MSQKQKKVTAKEKCRQRLLSLEKSLESLNESHDYYIKEPERNIHIMALIKSFELSFELSWLVLKYFIQYKEINNFKYARDIIKYAFNKGIIQDGDLWINMLEIRNKLSHVYDAQMVQKFVKIISKKYIKEINNSYHFLKKEL